MGVGCGWNGEGGPGLVSFCPCRATAELASGTQEERSQIFPQSLSQLWEEGGFINRHFYMVFRGTEVFGGLEY